MRAPILLLIVWLALASSLHAEEANSFGIRLSGFVKTDAIWDTRQTVALREGHFLLFPVGPKTDGDGQDINERVNFNIMAIQTRLKGALTGPDAFGAATSGLIEAEFFGTSDADVSGFRFRHAFFNLDWQNSSLMIGQFWHPMFVTSAAPGTISFNTGAPFQPFSRNPQVRWTVHAGRAHIIAAAIAQRDFTSTGPDGASSKYLRNTAIPNLHLQLQWDKQDVILGIGGDWKRLTPRLETAAGFKSTGSVSSMAGLAYARFNLANFVCKIEGVYGQNLTDHLMLGGYGVTARSEGTGMETYAPTTVYSVWTDIATAGRLATGFFAGVTQNLGAGSNLTGGDYWARGSDIDMIYRLAPRLLWNAEKTTLAMEVEYTAASYGATAADATVQNAEFVGNLRLLLAAYYYF